MPRTREPGRIEAPKRLLLLVLCWFRGWDKRQGSFLILLIFSQFVMVASVRPDYALGRDVLDLGDHGLLSILERPLQILNPHLYLTDVRAIAVRYRYGSGCRSCGLGWFRFRFWWICFWCLGGKSQATEQHGKYETFHAFILFLFSFLGLRCSSIPRYFWGFDAPRSLVTTSRSSAVRCCAGSDVEMGCTSTAFVRNTRTRNRRRDIPRRRVNGCAKLPKD